MGGGPGRGPTIFLGQTEARRAKKNYKRLDIGTEPPREKKKMYFPREHGKGPWNTMKKRMVLLSLVSLGYLCNYYYSEVQYLDLITVSQHTGTLNDCFLQNICLEKQILA